MYAHQTVLFHTHGLGPFDFSAMDEASLPALNRLAASRKALICPTIYLTADRVNAFEGVGLFHGRVTYAGSTCLSTESPVGVVMLHEAKILLRGSSLCAER